MQPPPVQYVTASDGINVAYTVCGAGRPFVFAPNLANHVLLSWELPHIGPWLRGLAERFTLVRYDSRGMGMSTRGLPEDHSFEDYQLDLEAVLERLQLERFVLCAQEGGVQIAVRFAVRHPEQVAALVIIGGSVSVLARGGGDLLNRTLPEQDWEMFLHTAAGLDIASSQDVPRTVEVYRQSVTQQDWVTLSNRGLLDDIEGLLSQLRTPTLVLHPRDHAALSVEASMKLAQLSHGQLVVIDGADSHGDSAQGIRAIESFLAGLPQAIIVKSEAGASADGLSSREVEVLRLIVAGKSNQQIADELVIALNTVQRHVSHIFDKTGAANRAEAAVYAVRHNLS